MSIATTIDVGPRLFLLGAGWMLYALARLVHRLARREGDRQPAGVVSASTPTERYEPAQPQTARRGAAPSHSDVVGEVCRTVARRYGVSAEELLSASREQPTAIARQVAMRLTRELTKLPYVQIGARFGRDHSTVIHAIRHTDGMMLEDLREEIRAAVV